jgi:hypothetical protein
MTIAIKHDMWINGDVWRNNGHVRYRIHCGYHGDRKSAITIGNNGKLIPL